MPAQQTPTEALRAAIAQAGGVLAWFTKAQARHPKGSPKGGQWLGKISGGPGGAELASGFNGMQDQMAKNQSSNNVAWVAGKLKALKTATDIYDKNPAQAAILLGKIKPGGDQSSKLGILSAKIAMNKQALADGMNMPFPLVIPDAQAPAPGWNQKTTSTGAPAPAAQPVAVPAAPSTSSSSVLVATGASLSTTLSRESLETPKNLPATFAEQPNSQLGSNPGAKYTDMDSGKDYYVKTAKSEQHARIEVLSSMLYRQAGSEAPQLTLAKDAQGNHLVVSPWMEGSTSLKTNAAGLRAANSDFAAHATFANWDAIGLTNDNQLSNKNKVISTVDVGGSLIYRAQGTPKPFTGANDELHTLRNPLLNAQAAAVFGDSSAGAVGMRIASAEKLLKNLPTDIRETLIDASGLSASVRSDLKTALTQRIGVLYGALPGAPPSSALMASSVHKSAFTMAPGATQTPANPATSASASSAISAFKKAQPGEIISGFRVVAEGFGDSPHRSDLANAARLTPNDFVSKTVVGNRFTHDMNSAISNYQGDSHGAFNGQLRFSDGYKGMPNDRRAATDALDDAINLSRTPRHGHIVRAVSMDEADERRIVANGAGFEFVDRGFTGGSHSKGAFQGGVTGNQTMRINIPKGTPALAMNISSPSNSFMKEGEVLLPRNSRFRVVSAEMKGSRLYWTVDWLGVDRDHN